MLDHRLADALGAQLFRPIGGHDAAGVVHHHADAAGLLRFQKVRKVEYLRCCGLGFLFDKGAVLLFRGGERFIGRVVESRDEIVRGYGLDGDGLRFDVASLFGQIAREAHGIGARARARHAVRPLPGDQPKRPAILDAQRLAIGDAHPIREKLARF